MIAAMILTVAVSHSAPHAMQIAASTPSCVTIDEDHVPDPLIPSADAARKSGNHRLAMTIYARAAAIAAHCAPIMNADTLRRAEDAGAPPGYETESAFYTRPMVEYFAAASEAHSAGLAAERCRYTTLGLAMKKHTDHRHDPMTAEQRAACRAPLSPRA